MQGSCIVLPIPVVCARGEVSCGWELHTECHVAIINGK